MSDLLKINVNDHVEKKNGLTYLSWAWAWAEVLKIDPSAKWELVDWGGGDSAAVPVFFFPDGSAMVSVSVRIKDDTKASFLPVMNHRNQAIKNPDAFAINTAIMRCLAKAIAMHGLGLYIYAGEDLPEEDATAPDAKTAGGVISAAKESAKAVAGEVSEERKTELYRDLDEVLSFAERGQTKPLLSWWLSLTDNNEKILAHAEIPSGLRAFLKKNGG
jgi:hypothetical protein